MLYQPLWLFPQQGEGNADKFDYVSTKPQIHLLNLYNQQICKIASVVLYWCIDVTKVPVALPAAHELPEEDGRKRVRGVQQRHVSHRNSSRE